MSERTISKDQLTAYRGQLLQEERAAATVEKYLRDAETFAAWLGNEGLTKEAVVCWKNQLLEDGLSPATVNAKLAALNGLLAFLGMEQCRAKFLKLQRRTFRNADRDLTQEEYQRLLAAARRSDRPQTELLLETICATGIRVSEVRYITVETVRQGRTEVSLKGKIRTILLPVKLCRKLHKYAQKQKITSGAIFRTRCGTPLTRFQIWRAMKLLCREARVAPSKVFPHNLRHLFAASFYRATRDIVKLADVLGHSSINTTRRYLLSTGAEHARQLELLGLIS